MLFAYNQGDVAGVFPDLGDNYSADYGYDQYHRTVKIWLCMWSEQTKYVKMNATPTSCWRLLDLTTTLWNNIMGNDNTVRNVVKKTRAKRVPNSGPVSLVWYIIFD